MLCDFKLYFHSIYTTNMIKPFIKNYWWFIVPIGIIYGKKMLTKQNNYVFNYWDSQKSEVYNDGIVDW